MNEVEVTFKKIKEEATVPSYAHVGDAAMDLYALEQRTLEKGEPYLFHLGFASEFPQGYVALIQDRSSMGKRGVRTLGGVIDSGYRGEWGVILVNVADNEVLSGSSRGEGGFGSSGK